MDFPPELTDDPYYHLAQTGPYAPVIGAALITMVEPHVGHERAYNRWYEDDHYNAGAMAFPWMWAGRRYVAPVPYQEVRYPADSVIAQPIEAGKYISIYWITEGQYENHLRFAVGTNHRLFADGRVFMDRDHTFTSFQRYLGPIYRDDDGPRDIHSLNYPYGGLVVEVIDANDSAARDELVEWLRAERAPESGLAGGDGDDVRAHAPARRQAALREGRRRVSTTASRSCGSRRATRSTRGTSSRAPASRWRRPASAASSSWRRSRRRSPAPTATSTSCARPE